MLLFSIYVIIGVLVYGFVFAYCSEHHIYNDEKFNQMTALLIGLCWPAAFPGFMIETLLFANRRIFCGLKFRKENNE